MSARVRQITAQVRAILKKPAGRKELALLASVLAFYQVQAFAALMRRSEVSRRRAIEEDDRDLTPSETAAFMGVSTKWLQRRRHRLSFIHPLDPDDPNSTRWRASLHELRAWRRRARRG
jgi:hypothetical protein